MSRSNQVVKSRTSVLERTKQFESLSHSPPPPKEENDEESESDDDVLDFASLVRNITSENQEVSGVSDSDALLEAFKILDFDEDGFITISDLRNALKMFEDDEEEESDSKEEDDEDDLKEMIAEADFDGDGQISFDDFMKVLTKPEEKNEEKEEETTPKENTKKKKKKSKDKRKTTKE